MLDGNIWKNMFASHLVQTNMQEKKKKRKKKLLQKVIIFIN